MPADSFLQSRAALSSDRSLRSGMTPTTSFGVAGSDFSALAFFFSLFFFLYLPFLNHVDINELGIAYDSLTGTVTLQQEPGWYSTSPFVRVAYINTLPIRVIIPSNAAVINQKVVRFKEEGIDDFIRLQGFSYSLNSSLSNILLGYAYSGKTWPFLEVMQEGGPESFSDLQPLPKK